MQQGQASQAIEAFTASITLQPNATCFCYRGLSEFEVDEFDKALEDYTRAIELDDSNVPEAYYFRGVLYGQMGDHGDAIVDLSAAIKLNDQIWIADAYYHRAASFDAVGEYEMCVDDMMVAARYEFEPAQMLLLSKGLRW